MSHSVSFVSRWRSAAAANRAGLAVVAAALTVFVWTGVRGLDFGRHWDEPLLLDGLAASLHNRLLLPTGIANYDDPQLRGGDYEYPTLLYGVIAGSAAPELLGDPAGLSPPSTAFVHTRDFGNRVRRNCLLISSLAVLWTYAAAGRVVRRPVVAAVAAALVGTSWQVGYHARYIATDGILMQWAALCLALCLGAVTTPSATSRRRLTLAAAVVAGLGTGTKYPGGLLVAPVLATAWATRGVAERWPATAARMGKLLAVQAAAFVVTTPGAVLQPWNFLAWVRFDRYHYGTLGHAGHTIRGPVAHAMAMADYLSLALFSPSAAVAAAAFVAAVAGAAALVARRRWAAVAVVALFPILYVGYFASQVVMLVRNLLAVAPFLAVLAAVGLDRWLDATAGRPWGKPARWATAVGVAVALAGNAVYLASAADAAARRDEPAGQVAAARDYLAGHPELAVYPTEPVAADLGLPLIPATGTRPVVLAFAREDGDTSAWPANVRGLVEHTFGSLAYDVDYAPDWWGNALLLLVDAAGPAANARRCPVAQVERAVARLDAAAACPPGYAVGPVLTATGPNPVAAGGLVLGCDATAAVYFYHPVGVPAPGPSDAWVGQRQLTVTAAGLDPDRQYRIAWAAWDHGATDHRRTQAAAFESSDGRTRVQRTIAGPPDPWPLPRSAATDRPRRWPPPAAGPAGSGRSTDVDLPPEAYRDGRCRMVLRGAGESDATASAVWLYVGPPRPR